MLSKKKRIYADYDWHVNRIEIRIKKKVPEMIMKRREGIVLFEKPDQHNLLIVEEVVLTYNLSMILFDYLNGYYFLFLQLFRSVCTWPTLYDTYLLIVRCGLNFFVCV